MRNALLLATGHRPMLTPARRATHRPVANDETGIPPRSALPAAPVPRSTATPVPFLPATPAPRTPAREISQDDVTPCPARARTRRCEPAPALRGLLGHASCHSSARKLLRQLHRPAQSSSNIVFRCPLSRP